MRRKFSSVATIFICLIVLAQQVCVHDQIIQNATFHYYSDFQETHELKQGRLLQNIASSTIGSIRIFNDYTMLKTGNQTQINVIKRVMNISANYFYNIIKVPRLDKLVFPLDSTGRCGDLSVPFNYMTTGTIADLGIFVTNEANPVVPYVAKSSPCTLLKSNNRPIWGYMFWNNLYLQYDQVGFQKIVFVAIHEIIHILGYSAALYDKYPAGNPYRSASDGKQYLTSPAILAEMSSYYGCSNPLGIILQDQDGTLIPSHNERKVFGNQAMTASAQKGAYMSRATMALLASTGWYTVSYDYAQPSVWGKSKGCGFLDINNCASPQFCPVENVTSCDWDVTAIGSCKIDPFTGACKTPKVFTNTLCIDENYELKNLNAPLEAQQRGGHNSRCFSSSYRKTGMAANLLNNRCYITVCSVSKSFLYILVGGSILYCGTNNYGIEIPAPPGLDGTLKCPMNFSNYCDIKKTCLNGCNKNGVCINGQCLCTGSTVLTSSCLDTLYTTVQVDSTGGLTSAIIQRDDILYLTNSHGNRRNNSKRYQLITKSIKSGIDTIPGIMPQQIKALSTSINSKCIQGTFFDRIFGECVRCGEIFGCQQCNANGCTKCPNGLPSSSGKCLSVRRL